MQKGETERKVQRTRWLIDHKSLWEGAPGSPIVGVYFILDQLIADGLYSKKSTASDLIYSLLRQIDKLRSIQQNNNT